MLSIVISAALLLIGVLFMGVRIFFVKDGKFPNTHIGGSEFMKKNKVSCATSQDRAAQADNRSMNTFEIIKKINK